MQVAATVWWRQQVTLFLVLILLSTSILGRTQSTDEKQLPRIVAMGDLHGDLANTLAIMKHAGIVDDEGRWAGGNAIFVQTVRMSACLQHEITSIFDASIIIIII